MKRKRLVAAREKKGWDQQLLADHVYPQVSRTTVSNWERALKTPRPHYKHELCRVLGFDDPEVLLAIDYTDKETNESQDAFAKASLGEDKGFVSPLPEEELHESTIADPEALLGEANTGEALAGSASAVLTPVTSCVWQPPTLTIQNYIASNPARHFWQIAHTDYSTSDAMTAAIQATIKEMNMTTGDEITRRDALCELASIPMIAMGKTQTLKATRYEEMLRFCTVALEGCWELYRGSDAGGAQHAFDCVCTYVRMLEMIAHDSAQHRKNALNLATRYALLKTLLGWGCVGAIGTVPYAQEAMNLSTATGDILLQVSACTKLGWAYSAARKPIQAHKTMLEGGHMLKDYQSKKNNPPLPSYAIGSFNSTYALVEAKNGLSPDVALGIATNSNTGNDHTAFIVFTESAQCLEAAHTCNFKGDPTQTMIWVGKRINTETLAPLPKVAQSERGRIETINVMTRALLQSKERDMKRIIAVWTTGIEGAISLRNEQRYNEATANFEVMQALWPTELAIRRLMPLTSHW
jgi:transcriptional regulator with XRE-family HTH domain